MALDWLNENSRRAYPFTDASPAGRYREVILDAVFMLGDDFDFNFDDETSELRLVSVAAAGSSWVLTFRYFQNGIVVGSTPALVFTAPLGGPSHVVLRASTAGSHGSIIIGAASDFIAETPSAPVEARTITAPSSTAAQTISVYNADKRKSVKDYFVANPGQSPGQNYKDAVEAAPKWEPNRCTAGAVGAVSSGICKFVGGFNVEVRAAATSKSIYFSMLIGAGGCTLCGIKSYVDSKLGTSDPCADLDKDGTVSSSDVNIAKDLAVCDSEITFQGTLRTLNGAMASNGDLKITAGNRVEVSQYPDLNKIHISIEEPSSPTKCVTKP